MKSTTMSLLSAVIGAGALLAIPAISYSKPVQDNPIESTQDVGTELDKSLAKKARKLAKLVSDSKDNPNISSYNTHSLSDDLERYDEKTASELRETTVDYFETTVELEIDKNKYEVVFYNAAPNTQGLPNGLEINITNLEGRPGTIRLEDNGLDGNCNYGEIPDFLSNDRRSKTFTKGHDDERRDYGLELQPEFQKMYEDALDRLIGFYKN
ncbi:MAG: hypothetical protein ABIG93_02135 [archaeon]|nr:hypothetical protein [Nanoarchaeota archaeon]